MTLGDQDSINKQRNLAAVGSGVVLNKRGGDQFKVVGSSSNKLAQPVFRSPLGYTSRVGLPDREVRFAEKPKTASAAFDASSAEFIPCGDYSALSQEVVRDLYWFAVTERVSLMRVEDIKRALKETLNIPRSMPIYIFTDSSGNAWNKNSVGQILVEGHLSLTSSDNCISQVGFSFNATLRRLHVDGVEVRRSEVPQFLNELLRALARPIALAEVYAQAEARAQTVFFSGEVLNSVDGEWQYVVVTQNYLAPQHYHVFVGTALEMEPLKITSVSTLKSNLGVFLRGLSRTSGSNLVFVPFRYHQELAALVPSINGVRILEGVQGAYRDHGFRGNVERRAAGG